MLSFKIIQPSPALRHYVRYYWTLQEDTVAALSERTLPMGCIQLFFHKGRQLFSPTRHQWQPRFFVCGQDTTYTDVCTDGNLEMIVVVFQPYAARLFFRQPLSLFQGGHVAVEDLEDAALSELARKIADTESHTRCIEWIERFLTDRLRICPDYQTDRLCSVIQHVNGNPFLQARELADVACLCSRQFTRVFTDGIGASPKDFLRIVRIQRALYLLQRHPDSNHAQIAYACGFADQSHMIREFKLFSGYTPMQYLSVCNPVSDYFSSP